MAVTINASTSAGLVNTADTSGVLQLQTAGTTALTVDTSANVGIGTASPASKLDVTATLRAVSSTAVAPTSGKGVEVWYDSSGDFGRIATYDRTGAAYKNQYIDGAALYLNSQSSGNVGIGTNSPVTKLDVTGIATVRSNSAAFNTTPNTNYGLNFQATSTGVTYITSYSSGGSTSVAFATNSGGGAASEAMRIDSSGNLLVGQTSADGQLAVTGTGTTALFAKSSGTTSSTYATIMRNSASTNIFFVRSDGFINTGLASGSPYNNSITGRAMIVDSAGYLGYLASIRSAKTNIQNLTDVSWLYNLNPVEFNYRKKDENNAYTDDFEADKHYGLIAEEVETVNKELCFYDEDKTLRGVSYEKLTSVLIKAIQEQQALITKLQADVAALKGKA